MAWQRTRPANAEVLPLGRRAGLTMVFRVLLVAVVLGVTADPGTVRPVLPVEAAHLVVTGLLTLAVSRLPRPLAIRCFGVGLLLDALDLQYLHVVLGPSSALDVAMAANLVVVCLVASFRTGLKIGLWQSLLILTAQRSQQAGLLSIPPVPDVAPERALVSTIALLWTVLLATAAAAATNERELRRRRYDAQVLARFAGGLYAVEQPVEVLTRLVRLAVEECAATRGLVCEDAGGGLRLVCGEGVAAQPVPPPRSTASALLAQPLLPDGATLALQLDPARDPWLARLLPEARRLVAIPLSGSPTHRRWLVFEHGAGTGSRVERRVIATAVQACATAGLAHARATLLEEAHLAATRDGLTGVANRRALDGAMGDLVATWRRGGPGFALVMTDVDRFKLINDTWGHPMGDEVLRAVARSLEATVGATGTVARFGGEEFAVLLPGLDLPQAIEVAERARRGLHDMGARVPVTASFGISVLPPAADLGPDVAAGVGPERGADPGQDAGQDVAAELVQAADMALLRAKGEGRDRVCAAGRPVSR